MPANLAGCERLLGPDHPIVAVVLYRLASVQLALDDAPAAVQGLRRAVGIDEAAYGDNHPKVATDLEALAAAQQMASLVDDDDPELDLFDDLDAWEEG